MVGGSPSLTLRDWVGLALVGYGGTGWGRRSRGFSFVEGGGGFHYQRGFRADFDLAALHYLVFL